MPRMRSEGTSRRFDQLGAAHRLSPARSAGDGALFGGDANAAVRARGGVFIRSRSPSCAGDRVFRMGAEMGGIRRCFRILLE